ncbi:helix-turn-helix transcriptional regulator [Roseimaritima sediminicola]|uniref:helix-turn-helix transcriptional regulator n=1 Tax=Roseimaritima sediminicola TaxID=2662066 RepID=UPI001298542C|nr:WYL domain-containing transcriptional regulator [Roseimaritima sediminicola]
MARNEQLIRQHKILQLLEMARFGRTLDEVRDDLIADLGLSSLHERTVRRDLEALMAAGFDLQTEQVQRGKVYKLGRTERGVHKITATATELIALSIGRDLLYPLVGTQYWQGIESFWNKIQEEMPEGVWEHYERFRKSVHVMVGSTKSYQKQEGILRTINRAVAEHRVVQIDYEPVGRPASTRRIEPYGLAVYQSSLYVVAAAAEVTDPQQRMRHWKLDRFHKATALDEWFKPDPEVDVSKHLKNSIGIFSGDSPIQVRIRLGPRAAAWVREDPWHPEQQMAEQDEGDFVLTVPASHPREVLPKVLALGADAEVLEPPEVRQAVVDAVSRLAETYKT